MDELEEEKTKLEKAMNRRRTEEDQIKIVKMETIESGLKPGDHYGSDLTWYKIVFEERGNLISKSIIVKQVPEDRAKALLLKDLDVFNKEIWMYETVLAQMEKLMKENQDNREILWPSSFGSIPGELIIIEDLKDLGYWMGSRRDPMSKEQALIVLRGLARFHVMSAILLETGRISKDSIQPGILESSDLIQLIFQGALETLTNVIRKHWEPEWKPVAHKLENLMKCVGKKLKELTILKTGHYFVINHGDCWTNNILFKNCDQTGEPLTARFVDFQGSHYNSCEWDLTNFLYASVHPDIRKQHYDEFLHEYLAASSESALVYSKGTDIIQIPDFDELKQSMSQLHYYGFLYSCAVLPLLMADPEDAFDIDSLVANGQSSGHKEEVYKSQRVTQILKDDLRYFMSLNILD